MTVFVRRLPGLVLLRARAEGPGPIVGDLTREVRPGGSALGRTYEQWAATEGDRVEVVTPA